MLSDFAVSRCCPDASSVLDDLLCNKEFGCLSSIKQQWRTTRPRRGGSAGVSPWWLFGLSNERRPAVVAKAHVMSGIQMGLTSCTDVLRVATSI